MGEVDEEEVAEEGETPCSQPCVVEEEAAGEEEEEEEEEKEESPDT